MNHLRFFLFLSLVLLQTVCSGQTEPATKNANSKPFVLGVVEEIQSAQLSEKRILNIYLPEGYAENDSIRYPVIYLLDGSADEDFIHIVGLVQFNSFEWINRVPKSIVVGIASVDRRRDFTFPTSIEEDLKKNPGSGHSDKFIAFIEKDLQPFIEKKYRTNTSRTIIGQSLGGLLATEILLKKPALFDTYIIVSPSLWWNNGSLLAQNTGLLKNTGTRPIRICIAAGKEGLTPTAIPRVMEVDANLLAEKIKAVNAKNTTVYFDYLPSENHASILHQAVNNAFIKLYQHKNPD